MARYDPNNYGRVFLTTSETATILRVSERTLGRWRESKQTDLPFTNRGHGILYNFSDVMKYLRLTRGSTFECRPGTGCGIIDLIREEMKPQQTSYYDDNDFGFG